MAGLGRSGQACFSMAPADVLGTDWQSLAAENADLRVAAEVVVMEWVRGEAIASEKC